MLQKYFNIVTKASRPNPAGDWRLFDLALNILQEWRLDRYYIGKARLFDTAVHVAELTQDR